jgi:hypothetical protein
MLRLIKRFVNKILWVVDSFFWSMPGIFIRDRFRHYEPPFAIGITTYKDRFTSCLKQILRKLSFLFPGCQIYVLANGHYLKEEQVEYLDRIQSYCSRFSNVRLISYIDPQGLSFLWNTILKASGSSRNLILNDDIDVKRSFARFIDRSGILQRDVATINSSWSHFFISESIVERAGFFDENLPELGGEDDDYLARLAILGILPDNYMTNSLCRKSGRRGKAPGYNSYGKDMSVEEGGYSTLNTRYLGQKWETSDQYFEGAVEVAGRKVRFWKLREKEDTWPA